MFHQATNPSGFGRLLFEYQAFIFFIAIAVLSRILPHPENIAPLAATGLFAGAYMSKRLFLIAPVIAALISDLLGAGIYNMLIMATVYLGLLLSSAAGRLLLHGRRKAARLPVAVLASALGFYLVSNAGAWWTYYPHSFSGLMECYINGVPYLGRTLLGDAFYSIVIFGAYGLLPGRQSRPEPA